MFKGETLRKKMSYLHANISWDKKEGKVKINGVHKVGFKFIEKVSVCFWWVLTAPLWDQF